MKNYFFPLLGLCVVMLGGCRLDGESLFGGNSSAAGELNLSRYDLHQICQEQAIGVRSVENVKDCSTPSDLSEILVGIGMENSTALRIRFNKMSDGTFPKLMGIKYRARSHDSSRLGSPRSLNCKLGEPAGNMRQYECKLEGVPDTEVNISFVFGSMDLAHDTCASKASFEAAYALPECEAQDDSYGSSQLKVFLRGKELPTLSPTKP
jgi:hypothetical protein